MSIFNSIEIDPNVKSYINNQKGVGIVKIQNRGKYSAIISQNQLIFNSYESSDAFKIPIEQINFIQYKEGNFINEPKLIIGVQNQQYVLAGVDNNDDELFAYYNTLLNIKNNQQQNNTQKQAIQNHRSNSMPQPNPHITNPNKMPQPQNFNNPNPQNIAPQQLNTTNDNTDGVELDAADEIRKYFQLKEDGIITEDEFNQKKKQLLGL